MSGTTEDQSATGFGEQGKDQRRCGFQYGMGLGFRPSGCCIVESDLVKGAMNIDERRGNWWALEYVDMYALLCHNAVSILI